MPPNILKQYEDFDLEEFDKMNREVLHADPKSGLAKYSKRLFIEVINAFKKRNDLYDKEKIAYDALIKHQAERFEQELVPEST